MEIVKDGYTYCSRDDEPAHQPLDPADAIERRTRVTVAYNMLIAMPAHAISYYGNMFGLSVGMELITDVTPAPVAHVFVDIVRGA